MLVLVGFMGAGKTTVGRIVAERLGLPFVDSDALIEQRQGRPIADIFEAEGERFFRQLEHETVTGLLRGDDAVLALGGGALGDERTREALREACVVYLRVGYTEALGRVGGDGLRPVLRRPDLAAVYEARAEVYQDAAVVTVDTDGRPPGEVARTVVERVNAPGGTSAPATRPSRD